ncbi:unnamed protein product [Ranitomeya imitator]|uniref:Uncharacterized protein n=1 Tax=Ranitomeya imitator TaxID=111125 RepID=A0ABN9L0D4_9NEOB|nr:unnamed protein product [Ranitomeya imitator]
MICQNCELEDKLEEYKERCKLREQRIALLEEKEAKYNDVMTIFRNQLHDANVKLELKEHDNMSLKSQESTKVNNHCCNQMCKSNDQEERDWTRGRSSLYALLIALKTGGLMNRKTERPQKQVQSKSTGARAKCRRRRSQEEEPSAEAQEAEPRAGGVEPQGAEPGRTTKSGAAEQSHRVQNKVRVQRKARESRAESKATECRAESRARHRVQS